jgi:hypothetical protein
MDEEKPVVICTRVSDMQRAPVIKSITQTCEKCKAKVYVDPATIMQAGGDCSILCIPCFQVFSKEKNWSVDDIEKQLVLPQGQGRKNIDEALGEKLPDSRLIDLAKKVFQEETAKRPRVLSLEEFLFSASVIKKLASDNMPDKIKTALAEETTRISEYVKSRGGHLDLEVIPVISYATHLMAAAARGCEDKNVPAISTIYSMGSSIIETLGINKEDPNDWMVDLEKCSLYKKKG